MARSLVTSRQSVVHYPYSLRFDDTLNQNIGGVYHASYTTDIATAFTILVYAKLSTRTNIANDFYALVSNGVGTNNNNYYLLVNSDSQTVSCYIANQVTSQILTSDVKYTNDQWNWFGMSYLGGTAQDVILNKTIKSQVPTLTVTMANNPLRIGTVANANLRINGYVARVWIMGGRITQAELNRVVDQGIKPPSLTQALMWDMSEGSGTSLDDSSPNSNTGTLNGGIAWESTITPGKTRTIASGRTLATSRTTV